MGLSLRHHDRSQLWFQLVEIVRDRTYLQHGIELTEGATVLDVGANVGVAAAFFAGECKAGVVHCFEPVTSLFELLRKNVSRFPACVAHDYGLAATAGHAEITYYPGAAAMSGLYADPERDREFVRNRLLSNGVPEGKADARLDGRFATVTETCELRTLSGVLRELSIEHVDLLKIDVERAELDVLLGVEERDWSRIAQIACEVHGKGGRLASITAILEDRGFAVTTDQDQSMRGTEVRMLYAIKR